MITVHVAQFLKDDPGARREIEYRETGPQLGDVLLAEPLEGSAELVRTQRGILVTMPYHATVTLSCGRCLNDFPLVIEDRFQDEVLAPASELQERVANRDDDALRIGEHYILDLGEIIRQELVMNTPLQPLCRPDCPGLCPTCGADLRTERCSCDQVASEGPFAALRQFLTDQTLTPPDSGR